MENAGNTVMDDFVFVEKNGKNVVKYYISGHSYGQQKLSVTSSRAHIFFCL